MKIKTKTKSKIAHVVATILGFIIMFSTNSLILTLIPFAVYLFYAITINDLWDMQGPILETKYLEEEHDEFEEYQMIKYVNRNLHGLQGGYMDLNLNKSVIKNDLKSGKSIEEVFGNSYKINKWT